MNLYSKYSNNPYDLNKIQLDSLINSCEYVNFYKIFEKFIQKINSVKLLNDCKAQYRQVNNEANN